MMNVAPVGYERYAFVTNLVPKYEIETVASKPPKRVTEPVDAVNTNIAWRRGMAARNTTGGNAIARPIAAKAVAGRYPEYQLNGPSPANPIWLGEASNGARDTASSRPVFYAKKIAALYERANTITVGKARA